MNGAGGETGRGDTPFWRALAARWRIPAIGAVAFIVQLCLPPAGPLQGFDEHVYGTYVRILNERGVEGLRAVAADWPRDSRLNQGPMPFRLTYVAAGAMACRTLGGDTLENLATVSRVFGILTVIAAAWLLGRWLAPGPAFVGSLLIAMSPLLMGLSRRALQDTCMAFWVVLAMVLFDLAWRERGWRTPLWLAIALTLGWLTKESMAFVYLVFAALAVYYGWSYGWRGRWGVLLAFVVPPLVFGGVCAWLAGGAGRMVETFAFYRQQQSLIPYARDFQQGAWYRYLVDFLLISPLTLVLAILGLSRSGRPLAEGRIAPAAVILVAGLAVFSCLPLLNLRIVAFLDIPLRILATVGLCAVAQRLAALSGVRRELVLIVLAAGVVLVDVGQFTRLFVGANLYDPVTAELIRGGGFVR